MTDAMMNKTTKWRPLVRHRRSQNAGVVYPSVAEAGCRCAHEDLLSGQTFA